MDQLAPRFGLTLIGRFDKMTPSAVPARSLSPSQTQLQEIGRTGVGDGLVNPKVDHEFHIVHDWGCHARCDRKVLHLVIDVLDILPTKT